MKKMLLMLGVAAAAMTSCTNDEVVEVNPTASIQFETFVNKGTRATTDVTNPTITEGIHGSGLKNFFVYGYYGTTSVFDGEEVAWVNKNGNTAGRWTYNRGTHKKWTGGDYYFAAYADDNEAEELSDVEFTEGTLTIPNYQVSDEKDLVAAWFHHNNNVLTNPIVDLDFKHMLSKVYFEIKNNASENLIMGISDIVISVAPSGTCSYNNGTTVVWNPLANATSKTFDGSNNVAQGSTHTSKKHFVIPGQTGIKAAFTATFYNGAGTVIYSKTYENVSLDVTGGWQAGYIYKYTAEVDVVMPTIEFGVSVTEWDSDLNGDGDLTNDDIPVN